MVLRTIAAVIILASLSLCWPFHPRPAMGSGSFYEGLKAARVGQLDRAIEQWTITLRRNPKAYAARVNRGSAYLMTGHVLKGIEDWYRARKHSPIFALAVYSPHFIGRTRNNRRVLNYALPLELDPDHVTSVLMMGSAYLDFGKDRMAVRLFKKSIDLTRNPMLKNHLSHWIKTIEASSRKKPRSLP